MTWKFTFCGTLSEMWRQLAVCQTLPFLIIAALLGLMQTESVNPSHDTHSMRLSSAYTIKLLDTDAMQARGQDAVPDLKHYAGKY